MECHAYCIASSYQIKALYQSLKEQYQATLYRDVVHLALTINGKQGDAFYFPYGVCVFWGLSQAECQFYIDLVKELEDRPVEDIASDEFTYIFGETAKIADDEVVLPNHDVLTRLAFSHGMAQSVKLDTFEAAIQRTFNNTKHLPEDLAKHGRIPLSRNEIRRKMGALFIERSAINLRVDILDTPEFFWEYSELEPYYKLSANYLDITTRVEVLNQRLDVVHELFEVLGNELNHQHASRLEWAIIFLIIIEVAISLLKDVFRII